MSFGVGCCAAYLDLVCVAFARNCTELHGIVFAHIGHVVGFSTRLTGLMFDDDPCCAMLV